MTSLDLSRDQAASKGVRGAKTQIVDTLPYMRAFVLSGIVAGIFVGLLPGMRISAFAETLSKDPPRLRITISAPAEQAPRPAQIAAELRCSVAQLERSADLERIEKIGQYLGEAWNLLSERGFPFPHESERAHFYAQILYESKNLQWMSEKNPKKSKIKNADLWRGRGPIQLSHCKNYAAFAWFIKSLDAKKQGYDLFREPADLHMGRCPPKSVSDSVIMALPDMVLGDDPMGGYRMSILSAVWWWQNRKNRQAQFREAIHSTNQNSVQLVTKKVKGSTETSEKRLGNFLVVDECIQKTRRFFKK